MYIDIVLYIQLMNTVLSSRVKGVQSMIRPGSYTESSTQWGCLTYIKPIP